MRAIAPPESGFSALREIGRNCRARAVPWRVDPYCRSLSGLRHAPHFHVNRRSGLDYPDRVKTVSKLAALEHLELALSEKQIPQIVENSKKCGELLEPLEGDGMRPRQVRYQAALRPDINGLLHSKPLLNSPHSATRTKTPQNMPDRVKTVPKPRQLEPILKAFPDDLRYVLAL